MGSCVYGIELVFGVVVFVFNFFCFRLDFSEGVGMWDLLYWCFCCGGDNFDVVFKDFGIWDYWGGCCVGGRGEGV